MSTITSLLTVTMTGIAITCIAFSAASKPLVKENALPENDLAIKTENCPQSFYSITLPEGGKLCQVFAADFPASMIFHVPSSPQQVVDFYAKNDSIFSSSKRVKDRFMLQSKDKNTTLIISADGNGAQVDVLVKKS